MTRNIRPLLDWCEAVGLVLSKDIKGTESSWWELSPLGMKILEEYTNKLPIWYTDLSRFSSAKAALLIVLQYVRISGLKLSNSFLKLEINLGLVRKSVADLIGELKPLGIRFKEDLDLETDLDFALDYDVPPDEKENVLRYIKFLTRGIVIQHIQIANQLEKVSIEKLKAILAKEEGETRISETERFARLTSISSDPLIARIREIIPTKGILSQYRSPFEKETAILLKLLALNAMKYQGQLADRCHVNHIMHFFENNPDLIIINGIESLVECKSEGEWHSPLKSVKSVPKEIIIYQQYLPSVGSNSIVIVYEGPIDAESRKTLESILDHDAKDVIFVNKNFLLKCIGGPSQKMRLISAIKNPHRLTAEARLLVA